MQTKENNSILKKIITTVFIVVINLSYSQAPSLKTWFNVGFEQKIKIKKFKFKVGVSQGFRVSNVIYTPRYSTYTEIGASTKITKFYKVALSYRLNYIGGLRNRIAISNAYKIELHKKLALNFRLKYQIELAKNTAFSQDIRLKTSLKWNANKDYKPYCFGEILYHNTYNYSNFDQYRLGIGLSADYKKKHNFDIMLMFVQEINLDTPRKSIVLGLEYLFSR